MEAHFGVPKWAFLLLDSASVPHLSGSFAIETEGLRGPALTMNVTQHKLN
jgi:hypothetical protein